MVVLGRQVLCWRVCVRPAEGDWNKRNCFEVRLRDARNQRGCDEQREHYGLHRERNSQRLPAPAEVACLRGCIAVDKASGESCLCRRAFWFNISITSALHGRTSFWRAQN